MSSDNFPLVSVIIPLFNREKYISYTLLSILNQEYPNWEAVVVDDGSTDRSGEIVENLAKRDKRIRILSRNRMPKGAATCRNIGIEQAQGKYVMFLDSDDLLGRACLSQRINYFQDNFDADFLVFPQITFDEQFKSLYYWNLETEEPDLNRFLKIDGVWCISGPIYKTDFLKEIDGFNEDLSCWQDIDIAIKSLICARKYKVYYDLNADVYIRMHGNESVSQLGLDSMDKLLSRGQLFREVLLSNYTFSDDDKSVIKVTYFLILYLSCFRFGRINYAGEGVNLLSARKFITKYEEGIARLLLFILYGYHLIRVNEWLFTKTINFFGKFGLRKLIRIQNRVEKERKKYSGQLPEDLLKYQLLVGDQVEN